MAGHVKPFYMDFCDILREKLSVFLSMPDNLEKSRQNAACPFDGAGL